MFEHTRALAGLPTLWHLTRKAGSLDRSEQILEAYGRMADRRIEEIWSDFVAFLLLAEASPATGGLKGPQFLRQAEPSWSGPLALPSPTRVPTRPSRSAPSRGSRKRRR
jgi:hypothetical protein